MNPTEYLKRPYARCYTWSFGKYEGRIKEFPGCLAMAFTLPDVMVLLEEVAAGWIAAALTRGDEIPAPAIQEGDNGHLHSKD